MLRDTGGCNGANIARLRWLTTLPVAIDAINATIASCFSDATATARIASTAASATVPP